MSSAMGPFETHEAQCRWAEPGSHGPLSGLGVMETMPHVLWSWTAQLPPPLQPVPEAQPRADFVFST